MPFIVLCLLAMAMPLIALLGMPGSATADALDEGFRNPPDSARPHAWWHWMNGNVTREGITADLEAMRRVGIGGAQIFVPDEDIPAGPAKYLGDEWRADVKFAAGECRRLGLELGMHNCAGWSSSGGPWVTPALAMQEVVMSEVRVTGPASFSEVLPRPASKLGVYRDVAVLAFPAPHGTTLVAQSGIVDLTRRMAADGRLAWEVPAGEWVVLRAGFTPNGTQNHPAPPEATGLECDKLSARAADAHFAAVMGRLLGELGPLAGTAFRNLIIDSYEVGGQNWTPGFEREFRKRRGYDPVPFLPVLAGRTVDSAGVSDRFRRDLKRTVADLFAEKYYGRMAELAHREGLRLGVEPYGNGPFEGLACGGRADVPMGEFWIGGDMLESCKLAASAGHTYGRRIIGAEAFTASPERAGWRNHPGSMKILGDSAFCRGVNRMIFHSFTHQPWMNRVPGMTMGQWGTHFGRLNTWCEPGAAWMKYLARCQFLLQQGRFVADALYFCGEDAPVSLRSENPRLPEGCDFDGCNSEVIFEMLSVRKGRLVLPGGGSYAVLVLPRDDSMTPRLLRRISKLVREGATVVGPKPGKSPSLEGYPGCDREVAALAAELWGDCDGKTVTGHGYGKGRVVWGKPLEAVFAGTGINPDFEYAGRGAQLSFIHRAQGGADIYFVSNQRYGVAEVTATFRVAGKVPELWYPETGRTGPAPVFEARDGRTMVPLRLDPAESVFVVFRHSGAGGEHAAGVVPDAVAPPPPPVEIRRAVYEAEDGTGSAEVTGVVRKMVRDGCLVVRAENDDLGGDPTPDHFKRLRVEYVAGGKAGTAVVREHETLVAPESPGSPGPAAWQPAVAADGTLELVAREAGGYEVRTSAGRVLRVAVPPVPGAVAVPGPWEVRFPAGWKAPEKTVFEKLISWSTHADDGIRYFSGTATYSTGFDLPEGLVQPGIVLTLDLGKVAVMAGVRVNDRDLGVLWKAPYRVDITGAAVAGRNRLEARVTNLWPNRLIGDARLPEDCGWDGDHLQAWPDWVREGKPSPAGRLTFVTWKHWRADSPLLESGLIGPVAVYPSRRVRIPFNR